MSQVSVKVDASGALRALERIRAKIQQLDPLLKIAAEAVVRDAQTFVPVDTGALRSSIHIEPGGVLGYKVIAGSPTTLNPRSGTPTSGYASYVEFGTSRMRARPYMRPALSKNIPAIFNLLKSMLRD